MSTPDLQVVRRPQILIVEDDIDLIELWSALLPLLGCQAFTAKSIVEAKAQLLAHPMDVIIMDLGLPDGYGLYGIRALLEAPFSGTLRPAIVVISGRSDQNLIKSIIQAGVERFLGKPVGKDQIMAVINQIMQRRLAAESGPLL